MSSDWIVLCDGDRLFFLVFPRGIPSKHVSSRPGSTPPGPLLIAGFRLFIQTALSSVPGCCLGKFCGPYHSEEGYVVALCLRNSVFGCCRGKFRGPYNFEGGSVITRLVLGSVLVIQAPLSPFSSHQSVRRLSVCFDLGSGLPVEPVQGSKTGVQSSPVNLRQCEPPSKSSMLRVNARRFEQRFKS